MVRQLADAHVVIADLTGRNPNVYYELGIAHALTKPVVVLIDDVTALPFDTQDGRSIELEAVDGRLTASGAAAAHEQLRHALEIVAADDYRPNNAVVQAGLARHFEELAQQGDDPTGVELMSLRQDMAAIKRQLSRIVGVERGLWGSPAIACARLVNQVRDRGGMSEKEFAALIASER